MTKIRFRYYFLCLMILCAVLLSSSSFAGTLSYEYDTLNRIIKMEKSGEFVVEYSYDIAGNRTAVTTVIQGPVFDRDRDGDIDGIDLKMFASGFSGSDTELADFADGFGSQNY